MNFSVEEENLICMYHTSDRRRTMARMLTALPGMNTEMRRMANGMLEVSNMIRKLNDENKIIIIVSHDFEFLGRTCDKIFDMEGCSKERR